MHVEEPDEGAFEWVLLERARGGRWSEIDRAPAGARTYHQAMAQGLAALESMVADLDQGPRQTPAAGSRTKTAAVKEPPAAPAASRPYFGFGPAR